MLNELDELLTILRKHGVSKYTGAGDADVIEFFPKQAEIPSHVKQLLEKPLTEDELLFDPMKGLDET